MNSVLGYVHDQAAFAALTNLERMRSDRSGVAFALGVFKFGSRDAVEQCAGFAESLRCLARATDHVGWMSASSVAVILWNTDAGGAWSFIDKVLQDTEVNPAETEVFFHPLNQVEAEESWIDSDESTGEVVTSDQAVEASTGSSPTAVGTLVRTHTDASTTVRIHRNLELTEQLIDELMESGMTTVRPARRTQPLESLLVQPLPSWKRTIDVLGASCGLILLSPLLLTVAAAIKLTSPGPVFFSQLRSGRGGKPFPMFKFRSMVINAEALKKELMEQNEQDGPAFKMENDPRITRVGHLIRKTSIDELPQLWNVLRGEMSIVGPRPLPCDETDGCDSWQRRRLDATPGLTCIWQVQDRRTKIPFTEWARMDIRYMKSRTLRNDMRLVLKTIQSVLGRKGS